MQVELSDWEKSRVADQAAAQVMTYVGHFSRGGRFTNEELADVNRWRALLDKVSGREAKPPLQPADFPQVEFVE